MEVSTHPEAPPVDDKEIVSGDKTSSKRSQRYKVDLGLCWGSLLGDMERFFKLHQIILQVEHTGGVLT